MPSLDSCISDIYEPGNIPADPGLPPTVPTIPQAHMASALLSGTGLLRASGGGPGLTASALLTGAGALRAGATTSSAGDPNFSSVVLLVIPEGVDGATGASIASPDYSPAAHTLTTTGAVEIDTAQFKFGTSSLLFSGASPSVEAADSADWTLPGAFTIEAWIRYASSSATAQVIVGHWNTGDLGWVLDITPGATNQSAEIAVSTDGTSVTHDVTVTDANYAPNTWIHLVGDRDSSDNLRLYVDGVMQAKKTSASGNFNSTSVLRIGCFPTGTLPFAGWIDSLRITKGVSRYGDVSGDSSFTPPTTEFPKS